MKSTAPLFQDTRDVAASSKLIDPAALMRIASLEMRARIVVEGFWNGIHRSPYHGFSVEFTEYRQYSPGDDTRRVDWRVYARSDRYFVKKFEDETNLRCYLLVDQSRSMSFESTGYAKAEYAATLAGTLAYFLHQQGDAVGMLSFGERIVDYLPARYRSSHLRQIMLALQRPAQESATNLELPLRRIAELVRRRAMIVLISDLLAPIDSLGRQLTYLRTCGHEVEVFHTLDPAERTFSFGEAARFRDVESGRDLFVDPDDVREDYLKRLSDHIAAVRTCCDRVGVGLHAITTDQPIELALFEFLTRRRQQRRGAMRREDPGSRAGGRR